MAEYTSRYYRLARIDDASPPTDLDYNGSRCVVVDGDLVLLPGDTFGGDGVICIQLFGRAFGHPQTLDLCLARESYDRLDNTHLTFPGGRRRKQGTPPHYIARQSDDGIELSPVAPDQRPAGLNKTFGEHRWQFAASSELLPGSDAAAG